MISPQSYALQQSLSRDQIQCVHHSVELHFVATWSYPDMVKVFQRPPKMIKKKKLLMKFYQREFMINSLFHFDEILTSE